MRTKLEIQAEIVKLETLKTRIPHHNLFGDDNWSVVEAQIQALKESLDRDEAYDLFSDEEKVDENRELEGALEAVDWMMEEPQSEAPSVGWSELVR